MVAKCANPECAVEFKYFGSGRLVPVSKGRAANAAYQGKVEWAWVCNDCSPSLTVLADGSFEFFQPAPQQMPPMPPRHATNPNLSAALLSSAQ